MGPGGGRPTRARGGLAHLERPHDERRAERLVAAEAEHGAVLPGLELPGAVAGLGARSAGAPPGGDPALAGLARKGDREAPAAEGAGAGGLCEQRPRHDPLLARAVDADGDPRADVLPVAVGHSV